MGYMCGFVGVVCMRRIVDNKEFKSILLKTLLRFNDFCQEHGIKYSIAYGTALGAIRHKGFIPWDDDIDVIMLRPEYEKFEKDWKDYAIDHKDDYTLWPEMDENNYFMAFCAKFFNHRTELLEHFSKGKVVKYGVYIDIFVLDHIPTNPTEQKDLFMNIQFYWKWIQHFQRHFKKWNRFVRKYHLPLPSLDMVAKRLMQCKNIYNDQKTALVSLTQDYQKKTNSNVSIYQYDWFNDFTLVEFEGHKLPIISAFDEMLCTTYGEYMKLPPKEAQVGHNVEAYWK